MAVTQVPRSRARARWTLFVVALSQLLVSVDVTVVNVLMPSAQRDLGMSDASKQWMISAYTLTFGGFLLLGGRVGDRFGRRPVLLVALCGFALTSATIGSALDPAMMVAARAAQGLFAALLAPTALSLLAVTFPDGPERTKALAVFSTVNMSGGVVGLIVGGAITQFVGWRWCMYVQAPLALMIGVVVFVALPVTRGERPTRLDWWSAVCCTAGVAALVYGLSESVLRGWASAYVIGALCLGLALLIGFVLRQTLLLHPLLPLTIFSNQRRVGSYLSIAILAFSMFGVWVFLTYQFQQVMGYGPLVTGLAFAPMLVGNLTGISAVGRRLVRWASLRQLLGLRLVVAGCGPALLTLLTPETSYWLLIFPAEILLGLGAGLALPVVVGSAVADVSPQDSGVASALFQASNMMGASLGTALLSAIAIGATSAAAEPHAAAAIAHGYAVSSIYAAGVLFAGAAFMGIFLRGSDRHT